MCDRNRVGNCCAQCRSHKNHVQTTGTQGQVVEKKDVTVHERKIILSDSEYLDTHEDIANAMRVGIKEASVKDKTEA